MKKKKELKEVKEIRYILHFGRIIEVEMVDCDIHKVYAYEENGLWREVRLPDEDVFMDRASAMTRLLVMKAMENKEVKKRWYEFW